MTETPPGSLCRNQQVFESQNFDASGNITWHVFGDSLFEPTAIWLQFTHNGGQNSLPPPSVYPVTFTLTQFVGGVAAVSDQWVQTDQIAFSARETHTFPVISGATFFTVTSHTDDTHGLDFGTELLFSQYCSLTGSSFYGEIGIQSYSLARTGARQRGRAAALVI